MTIQIKIQGCALIGIFGKPPLPYIASDKTHIFLRKMPDVERAAIVVSKM